MSKKKAIICTILFTIVLLAVWAAIFFVPTLPSGRDLWPLVTCTMSGLYMSELIQKFYNWLVKEK